MPRSILIFGFLIMFLVLVQYSRAQSVESIIDGYVKAIGGKEKWVAVKSIYMEGARQMMGNEVSVKVTKVQGKLSRTEFEMGAGNGFLLVTDKEAWSMFSMRSPTPTQMPAEAVAGLQTELDIAGPLVDFAAKGHKAELISKDSANGVECQKIKLTTNTGREILYWLDTHTNLLIQSSQKSTGGMGSASRGGSGGDVLTLYSDYNAIDGLLIAHSIKMIIPGGGMGGGETNYDKIELNKAVDPKLYTPE